jgi:hypothetical protein
LTILALVLALGLAFVSCDNGTTGGGNNDSITLYPPNPYQVGSSVQFTVRGFPSSGELVQLLRGNSLTVTIDGTNASLGGISGTIISSSGNTRDIRVLLSINTPVLVSGTRYAVTVVYSGTVVAPFTLSETVTCRN